MMQKDLLQSLVYLDKDYIADSYEAWSGESAEVTLTKHSGKNAGANPLPFSAAVSAQETRSYPVSTLHMLAQLWPELAEQPAVNVSEYAERSASEFGWVQGTLSTFQVRSKTQRDGQEVVTAQSSHFQLRGLEHAIDVLRAKPLRVVIGGRIGVGGCVAHALDAGALDLAISVDGWVGDSAISFVVGNAIDPEDLRLIKCTEEQRSGNHEFDAALTQQRTALQAMHCPEADWFIEHCLPCYTQNLDELTRQQ